MLDPTRMPNLRRVRSAVLLSRCCARPSTSVHHSRKVTYQAASVAPNSPRPPPTAGDPDVIGLPPPPYSSSAPFTDEQDTATSLKSDRGEHGSTSASTSASASASEPLSSHIDPFARVSAEPEPDPSKMQVARVALRAPWMTSVRRSPHPFNSHAFVSSLEKATLDPETAKTLMEGVRNLLVRRTDRSMSKMLVREEADNEAYVFKAALSKLRTEFNLQNRNTGLVAKDATSAVRRELEQLERKMAGDMQVLKHAVEMDMSENKDDNRKEMKTLDIQIEEINSRATISIGDLRTEIESAKWDSTRRAITIIVVLVVSGVGLSTLTFGGDDETSPSTSASPPAKTDEPVTRDIGIGPDEDPFDYETRIDKILSAVPPPEPRERKENKPRRNSTTYIERI